MSLWNRMDIKKSKSVVWPTRHKGPMGKKQGSLQQWRVAYSLNRAVKTRANDKSPLWGKEERFLRGLNYPVVTMTSQMNGLKKKKSLLQIKYLVCVLSYGEYFLSSLTWNYYSSSRIVSSISQMRKLGHNKDKRLFKIIVTKWCISGL